MAGQTVRGAAPEEEREVLSAGIPLGGTGTTVFTTEWQGRMTATVASDTTVEEEDAIVRAAERLVADPIGVLTEAVQRD